MIEIRSKLSKLKLSGFARTLETRNAFALENNISYIEFLELLLEDEFANRKSNSYRRRYMLSKLCEDKSIADYDFGYQPKLDKKLIKDLASCRYITEKKNIILMGNPGVGKTHISNGLGLEALKQGYKVVFTHCSELVEKLYEAKGIGSYYQTLKNYIDCDLLIIDELGFKKINYVDEFFEIIRKRYEHGSIIITTNRNFKSWGTIFGDNVLASAIIDRLVHHCYPIEIDGPSYRVKNHLHE